MDIIFKNPQDVEKLQKDRLSRRGKRQIKGVQFKTDSGYICSSHYDKRNTKL